MRQRPARARATLRPLPMQHAALYLTREDIPAASLALAEWEGFDPEPQVTHRDELPERPGDHYRELYENASSRLTKILDSIGLELTSMPRQLRPVQAVELEPLNQRLSEIWRLCAKWERRAHWLQEEDRQVQYLQRVLEKYQALDINLDLLHGRLRFLDIHIGSLHRGDIRRLRQAVGLIGYTADVFLDLDDSIYVVVAGVKDADKEEDLKSVLQAASFRHLELPPELRGHPRALRQQLEQRRQRIESMKQRLCRRREQARQTYGKELTRTTHTLAMASPCAQLADAVRSRGPLAHAWVRSLRSTVRWWWPTSLTAPTVSRSISARSALQVRSSAASVTRQRCNATNPPTACAPVSRWRPLGVRCRSS